MRQDHSSILSSLPKSFRADRKELLDLLLKQGILHRSPTQPISSRDGKSARWMLYSLGVTLGTRGAELAGRCLLQLLKHFDGRQLATYGLIGVPILQSCILQSGGRYRGLLVRKDPKNYGAARVIEGEIDPDEPVILVDDSIASGTAFTEGCERLEKAGLRVEGGVCLVRFGWLSGYSTLQDRGYHVEAVYDIYEDFMANMEDEPDPEWNPTKTFPEFEWSGERAPEGLHPADLARTAMLEYLHTGKLLRPPQRMDKSYDSSGGAWVSVRSRANIYLRHARDGFWHFPGEKKWSPAEDVVRAALRTVTLLPQNKKGRLMVESSHIAVTFFSALEECTVGQLDNDRYGIVVCSRERPSVMGGALPSMPGITNEYHQFHHAAINNGKLYSIEPYLIYRHEVNKVVEPEAIWQPTGVPRPAVPVPCEDPTVCVPIAERARDLAIAHLLKVPETTNPLTDNMLPEGLHSLFVTVYIWGQLRGCMGATIANFDDDLRYLVTAALGDERFDDAEVDASEAIAVSVSLLYNFLPLGEFSPEEVVRRSIHGRQALRVHQKNRSGMLLPFFAAMHSLNRLEYAKEVIDKAGVTRPPYHWERFDCATWLADNEGTDRLQGAFKPVEEGRPAEELLPELADLYSNYLVRHQKENGTFYESYEPFANRLTEGVTIPRLAHAAWVLARAHRILKKDALAAAADKSIEYLLARMQIGPSGVWLEAGEDEPSISEISFLMLALCELPRGDYRRAQVRSLAETLWSGIDRHGRIATHRNQEEIPDEFQDYFPGQALLALASACENHLSEVNPAKLQKAFRYYRHRYRHQRDFGQVSWLMQAFSVWARVQPDPEFSSLVFEIAGWMLQFQQEKTGGFINDHQPDAPGYTTAVYLEGIGAAARLAASLDAARHRRYQSACFHGMAFLNRLTIQPMHGSVLPNTHYAIGGVRQSLYSSFVRLDFVQHALSSVLELYPYLAAGTAREPITMEPIIVNAEALLKESL